VRVQQWIEHAKLRAKNWLQWFNNRYSDRKGMTWRSEGHSGGNVTAMHIQGGDPFVRLQGQYDRLKADYEALQSAMDRQFKLNSTDAFWSGLMIIVGSVLIFVGDAQG
jgi:hypothetical protein